MGCHALLQGIFPTHGLNLGLLCCRQIRYHLSHQGSPVITLAAWDVNFLWNWDVTWCENKWTDIEGVVHSNPVFPGECPTSWTSSQQESGLSTYWNKELSIHLSMVKAFSLCWEEILHIPSGCLSVLVHLHPCKACLNSTPESAKLNNFIVFKGSFKNFIGI